MQCYLCHKFDHCALCAGPFEPDAVKYIVTEHTRSWIDRRVKPPRRYRYETVPVCFDCLNDAQRDMLNAPLWSDYRWHDSEAPCPGCGHMLRSRWHRGPRKRVCSKACFQRIARARRRVTEATCEVCHEVFSPLRADSRYCSPACKQAAYRKRNHSEGAHANV